MNFTVELCERQEIRNFIETYHYSKNINGCISDFCFKLLNEDKKIIGAMFFGRLAMRNQYKRFNGDESKVIELRRLCCIDDTPKNTESFFIGRALRILSKVWRKDGIVISYSDKEHGHFGTIYKASNFKQLEDIPGAKVIIHGEKQYHDKAIRTKYKGKLKPFAEKLKLALENGEAKYMKTKGKCTFVYELTRR
jgi:hypothetical protein